MGTEISDLMDRTLQLGYITGGIIAVVILLHYMSRCNELILFWIAFMFTRPFGATFGDFLTKPAAKGGLDFNTLIASLVTLALMASILGYKMLSSRQPAR